MRLIRRRFLSLAAAAAATPFALQLARPQVEVPSISQGSHFVFPGVQWEVASPVELGWSIQGLAEAYQLFATLFRRPVWLSLIGVGSSSPGEIPQDG